MLRHRYVGDQVLATFDANQQKTLQALEYDDAASPMGCSDACDHVCSAVDTRSDGCKTMSDDTEGSVGVLWVIKRNGGNVLRLKWP